MGLPIFNYDVNHRFGGVLRRQGRAMFNLVSKTPHEKISNLATRLLKEWEYGKPNFDSVLKRYSYEQANERFELRVAFAVEGLELMLLRWNTYNVQYDAIEKQGIVKRWMELLTALQPFCSDYAATYIDIVGEKVDSWLDKDLTIPPSEKRKARLLNKENSCPVRYGFGDSFL